MWVSQVIELLRNARLAAGRRTSVAGGGSGSDDGSSRRPPSPPKNPATSGIVVRALAGTCTVLSAIAASVAGRCARLPSLLPVFACSAPRELALFTQTI